MIAGNTSVQPGSSRRPSRITNARSGAAANPVAAPPTNQVGNPSISTSRSVAATRPIAAFHSPTATRSTTATRSINAACSNITTRSTIAIRSINIRSTTAASNPAFTPDVVATMIILSTLLNQKRRRALPRRPRDYISVIPNEVLLDIFEIVLLLHPTWVPAHAAPVRLSQVCMLWRGLVFADPKLWTIIEITEWFCWPRVNRINMAHFPSTLLRVEHFLAMSKERPLTIKIELRTCSQDDWNMEADGQNPAAPSHFFQTCVERLSRLISPHVWRFKSFTLHCDRSNFIADIQSRFCYIPMPMLECWEVEHPFPYFEGDNETSYSVPMCTSDSELCTMFPRLQTAKFLGTAIQWSRFHSVHLRSLELRCLAEHERPDGELMRQMLLACGQSLESLILYDATPTTRAREPYEMPKLKHLELRCDGFRDMIPFIRNIRLPQLADLTIEDLSQKFYLDSPSEGEVEAGRLFFNIVMEHLPLHCLEHLNLRHVVSAHFSPRSNSTDSATSTSLFKFLCNLVALKSLTLADPDIDILNLLNYLPVASEDGGSTQPSQSPEVPLPALEVLRLERFDRDWDEIQVFLNDRILGRHDSIRRLNKLILSEIGYPEEKCAPLWIKDIYQSIDIRLLTKRFEYIDSRIAGNFSFSYSCDE